MSAKITCCIVLYRNNKNVLQKAINSCLNTELDVKMYLIDNSPTDELSKLVEDSRIEYFHNPSNPGFGAAHNIAIQKAIDQNSEYHFIINPDIYFTDDVIGSMVEYIKTDRTIGMMMPQILNEDGSIQNLLVYYGEK
jgi:GT2 family glycosyltransferase